MTKSNAFEETLLTSLHANGRKQGCYPQSCIVIEHGSTAFIRMIFHDTGLRIQEDLLSSFLLSGHP